MSAAGASSAVGRPVYVVVIPTVGRASPQACLDSLAATAERDGYPPLQVVLADDRRDTPAPLPAVVPPPLADRTTVVTLEGRGPAAARNAGWRAAEPAEWVVFLDDDVRVSEDWARDLAADLSGAAPGTGGVQGVLVVPWPSGGRPADSQRATLGLASVRWVTADMAYRHAALADADGFDERFPRAYREDSDLALRIMDRGWTLRRGSRRTVHPVPPPVPGRASGRKPATRSTPRCADSTGQAGGAPRGPPPTAGARVRSPAQQAGRHSCCDRPGRRGRLGHSPPSGPRSPPSSPRAASWRGRAPCGSHRHAGDHRADPPQRRRGTGCAPRGSGGTPTRGPQSRRLICNGQPPPPLSRRPMDRQPEKRKVGG